MKQWIVLFLWVAHAAVQAEPFEKAEVTRTVNLVSLLLEVKSRPATLGDVISGRLSKPGAIPGRSCSFPI